MAQSSRWSSACSMASRGPRNLKVRNATGMGYPRSLALPGIPPISDGGLPERGITGMRDTRFWQN